METVLASILAFTTALCIVVYIFARPALRRAKAEKWLDSLPFYDVEDTASAPIPTRGDTIISPYLFFDTFATVPGFKNRQHYRNIIGVLYAVMLRHWSQLRRNQARNFYAQIHSLRGRSREAEWTGVGVLEAHRRERNFLLYSRNFLHRIMREMIDGERGRYNPGTSVSEQQILHDAAALWFDITGTYGE